MIFESMLPEPVRFALQFAKLLRVVWLGEDFFQIEEGPLQVAQFLVAIERVLKVLAGLIEPFGADAPGRPTEPIDRQRFETAIAGIVRDVERSRDGRPQGSRKSVALRRRREERCARLSHSLP